ncbi:MAG: hypothetical protein FWF50_02610 [Defluviitaleaceae bacterium]|nr:hypothetical protein [Defluviitaleaceae bacterium]
MQQIFFGAFGIGIGYTILSLILGSFLSGLDGFDSGASYSVSPLRPVPIATFLTVFGGAGLILYNGIWSAMIVAIISAVIGIISAYILVRFVLLPLAKAQNTSTVTQTDLIGEMATVNEKIFENGFGKIAYNISGSMHTAPAKTEGGEELLTGTEVEITSIKDKIYYVKKIEKI